MDEEGSSNEVQQAQPNNDNSKGKNMLQKGSDKAINEAAKKAKDKVAKEAATKGKLAASMGPVIFWATVVIVAIIIIIGIIMFFVTMPGMVMEKIKALFKELGNYVSAFFGADTTQQIDEENIYETLDYLEEMGYDLKGFGFLTDYYTDEDQSSIPDDVKKKDENKIKEELKEEGKDDESFYDVDNSTGVVREKGSDEILLAESDFLFTYIASDNYIYTLKNYNLTTLKGSWNTFWGFITNIVSAMATASYKFNNFLFGPVYDFLGITDAVQDQWGHGLIALYYEGGGLGKKGYAVNTETLWNHDTVKIDTEKRELVIAKNELFNTNTPMRYSLDGWTGRYGMPVEFLLSVHVATMMPDLAYNMATAFDTNVNLYLRESTGSINAFYENENGKMVSYSSISKYIGWLGLDYSSMYKIVEAGVIPPDHNPTSCGCTVAGDNEDNYRFETMGEECEKYVRKVVEALEGANDNSYKTYTPYIADVTKHWYRDVYYVLDMSVEENKNLEFVVNDYDYESLMRERWSLYETYTKDENEEKVGEFKLFILTPDGEYATESTLPEEAKKDEVKDKVSKDKVHTDYYLYDGTKEEANDFGIIVSKKAVTIEMKNQETESEELADLSWNYEKGVWSAYESTQDSYTGSLEKAYPDITDENDVRSKIYTQVSLSTGNINQTGEAQRAETNPRIKRMFLYNTYFRYDGTKEVAEIITALRKKIKKNKLGSEGIPYGPLNELYNSSGEKIDATDEKYTTEELGFGKQTVIVTNKNGVQEEVDKTYSVRDYSGQVTINQDSLNAFSMLENTHTLDADYIYRDFKELVVELGYFEKEELTDEIPKLLEWLVPETGSAGYPNRTIDKREGEFGTMIHSKGDIDENKQFTLKRLLTKDEEFESLDPEDPEFDGEKEEEQTQTANLTSNLASNLTSNLGADPKEMFDTGKTPVVNVDVTNDDILAMAKQIFDGMINAPDNIRFEYCVGKRPENCDSCSAGCKSSGKHDKNNCSCTKLHCNHVTHDGRGCGYKNTFEEAIASPKLRNVCCAVYVGWVLRALEVDIDAAMEAMGNMSAWRTAGGMTTLCIEYLGAQIITEYDDLMPGDIMSYLEESHVDILGDKKGDNFEIYGCGIVPDLKGKNNNPDMTRTRFYEKTTIGMRFNGAAVEDGYVGYNGNEMVVSPVTGILLDYGTYNPNKENAIDWDTVADVAYRLNVDLKYGPVLPKVEEDDEPFVSQEVSDKVGYAKILVLNTEYYQALETSTENRWKKGTDVDENGNMITTLVNENGTFYEALVDNHLGTAEDKLKRGEYEWDEIDKTVYGYKEFAESYEKAGIAGYVIYIDGFVCEAPDKTLGNGLEVAQKIPYENDEEAKKAAKISMNELGEGEEGYSYKTIVEDNL